MNNAHTFDQDELGMLKSAILYIFRSFSKKLKTLGSVKLNKILWFSDSESLAVCSKTITGLNNYRAEYRGPVLPPLEQALNELDPENNSLGLKRIVTNHRINRILKSEYVETYIEKLSLENRNILNYWIEFVQDKNTEQVSEASHTYAWWPHIVKGSPLPLHLGASGLQAVKIQSV